MLSFLNTATISCKNQRVGICVITIRILYVEDNSTNVYAKHSLQHTPLNLCIKIVILAIFCSDFELAFVGCLSCRREEQLEATTQVLYSITWEVPVQVTVPDNCRTSQSRNTGLSDRPFRTGEQNLGFYTADCFTYGFYSTCVI